MALERKFANPGYQFPKHLAIEELARRNLRFEVPIPDLLEDTFFQQADFILDPARLKALFCTRRAAKSYTGGIYLFKEALENPGCNCLFLGLTRASAEGIVWKDILKAIDEKYELGCAFNESKLTVTLPNGSVIYVNGVDANEDEMKKLLGRKYRLVILDEASMYSINLRNLVYGILKPAVADWRGTICMMGTADNATQTLFFDITKTPTIDEPREPGWSVHEWTALDNPYIVDQWKEELAEIETLRPLFKLTALYRQWYLNLWEIDTDALVYKYNKEANSVGYLPRDLSEWRYLLGIDLAHSPDSTAFVIGAYHPADKALYIVFAQVFERFDFTAVAEKIQELEKTYSFEVKVVDGANKQGVAEMNNRHRSGLICAEKHGKVEYINLFNGELLQERIKFLPLAQPLVDQMKALVWVTDGGKVLEPREEHQGMHNDLCDAALYLWRYAYTYVWQPPEKKPEPGSQESWEPEHLRRLEEQVRQEQNPDELPPPEPPPDWDDGWPGS